MRYLAPQPSFIAKVTGEICFYPVREKKRVDIGGINALWQRWSWEGIIGTTVFVANEVKVLTDEELKKLVEPMGNDEEIQCTFSHKENWGFINFDFEVVGQETHEITKDLT